MTQAVDDETAMNRENKTDEGGAAWWVVVLAVIERGWLVEQVMQCSPPIITPKRDARHHPLACAACLVLHSSSGVSQNLDLFCSTYGQFCPSLHYVLDSVGPEKI